MKDLLPSRFVEKIQVDGECWNWTGSRKNSGYGQVRMKIGGLRKLAQAHRAVYELLIGEIPEGLTLDHLCRNRSCVNPAHLEPVTLIENQIRGNTFNIVNGRKTHCLRNHEFSERNTRIRPDGKRVCRKCEQERIR